MRLFSLNSNAIVMEILEKSAGMKLLNFENFSSKLACHASVVYLLFIFLSPCRVMEIDRHSLAPEVNPDDTISIDEHDFVPHFQRVSISGEDTSGVPLEDLERASKLLIQSLELRER